jgi:superfamily I DNA/RNA helicase
MNNTIGETTKEQILKRKRLFVVKACPGSGKTLSVTKRLAKILLHWEYSYRGVVTISFTNVAWRKIDQDLEKKEKIKTPIPYPHFLGTIDSFVNQYIFLPFGYLVMGCDKRPELVGAPYNSWEPIGNGWYWGNAECNRYMCKLNDFSYDINGNLINFKPKNHFNKCEINHQFCKRKKKEFNQKGYATQLDANYFAMKVLEEYPQIAKALSYRFPVLMVDETQDTSEIQMKIINLLIENGLQEVMLIGDHDQSIYEWRTAKPILFEEKYKKWKNNSLLLVENYRSSQKICDFFSNISSFNEIPALNNEYKDFDFYPQIWEYKNKNYEEIIDKFLNLCEDYNISLKPENIAVLSRSKIFLSEISGVKINRNGQNPWNDLNSKNIIKSKYLFDTDNYKDAFYLLEKTVCAVKNNKTYCNKEELDSIIREYGFIKWRKEIYNLIKLLPDTTEVELGIWIKEANKSLKENQNIITKFLLKIKRNKAPNEYSEISLNDIFEEKEVKINKTNYVIGTVHSVKGEEFEAVLLFVKKRGGNSQNYAKILKLKIEESEELRIIYVAITRPRKVLIVAVPKGDKKVWERKFFNDDDQNERGKN